MMFSQFAISRNKGTVMECKNSSHVSPFSKFCQFLIIADSTQSADHCSYQEMNNTSMIRGLRPETQRPGILDTQV